jgi:hypothetical protein
MDTTSVPLLAGIASTAIFAGSTLPMVAKALRTRDLSSYSLGNLVLINAGNAIYSVYVFALPLGPIWGLHIFYLTSSAAMLLGFLRFESRRSTRRTMYPTSKSRLESWAAQSLSDR